jgi:hypothetical protein
MRAALALLPVAMLVGCPGDSDTETDTETDEETPEEITERMFGELVTVTTAPVADDLACWASGDWITQSVDAAKQVDEARTVEVIDFETDEFVESATVEIWLGDTATGAADLTGTSNASGQLAMSLPACTPLTYKVSTPVELDETKDTYEAHQIFEPIAADDATEVNSVSKSTFLLIPSLLGVTVDEDKSIIAGGVQDCNGDPVEGAQVVVRGADGNIPPSLIVKYFVEDFPSRLQPNTSEDGLWVAINVPPGTWTVEAYVSDGAGGHKMVGTTELSTFADSINISNIYWGIDGGVAYPASCLATTR